MFYSVQGCPGGNPKEIWAPINMSLLTYLLVDITLRARLFSFPHYKTTLKEAVHYHLNPKEMDSAVGLLLEGLAALVCCFTANMELGRPQTEKNAKYQTSLEDSNQDKAARSGRAPSM